MKKFLGVLMVLALALVVVGCGKEKPVERTYAADGVYLAYELGANKKAATIKVEKKDAEGVVELDPEGNPVLVDLAVGDYYVPYLATVEVEIRDDKIVKFTIDERQGSLDGEIVVDENNKIVFGRGKTGVKWNDKTKKQLGYDYNMNFMKTPDKANNYGEWFIHALAIERHFLAQVNAETPAEPSALASSSITQDNYVELAKQAIANAKAGKVQAIVHFEHYKYDATVLTADINETKDGFVNFAYNGFYLSPDTGEINDKKAAYGPMKDGVKWQDQIKVLEDYLNANGYPASGAITPGKERFKGVLVDGATPEALASVTIQVHGEVATLHKLFEYFNF